MCLPCAKEIINEELRAEMEALLRQVRAFHRGVEIVTERGGRVSEAIWKGAMSADRTLTPLVVAARKEYRALGMALADENAHLDREGG